MIKELNQLGNVRQGKDRAVRCSSDGSSKTERSQKMLDPLKGTKRVSLGSKALPCPLNQNIQKDKAAPRSIPRVRGEISPRRSNRKRSSSEPEYGTEFDYSYKDPRLQPFVDRVKAEISHIKGTQQTFRANKLNEKILKNVEKMFERVRDFNRGETTTKVVMAPYWEKGMISESSLVDKRDLEVKTTRMVSDGAWGTELVTSRRNDLPLSLRLKKRS
nr:hypothetical protein [Tanacetum cinerariifolium]